MALPQKVVDRLAIETPKTPGWTWHLLMFTSTLFFLSILAYAGLSFSYKPYLQSQVDKGKKSLESLQVKVPPEQQAELQQFYSEVTNLRKVLTTRVFGSPLLSWLEKNTEKNVYYTKFSLDATGKVALTGIGKSAQDVLEQIKVFEESSDVSNATVGSVAVSQDGIGIQFTVMLTFRPAFFSAQISGT